MSGLKKLFNVMKNDGGLLIPAIDRYLLSLEKVESDDDDRGHGLNSPSGVGSCIRSQYFRRMGEASNDIIEPRVKRIFDNGHGVHDRLQTYLEKCGKLLMREVPVYNEEYETIGHCDGVLKISPIQLAILEIKSINDSGFNSLITEKEEHRVQAQVYMWAIEMLRQEVLKKGFNKSAYLKRYEKLLNSFVKEGNKYSKKEKVAHGVKCMSDIIDLLIQYPKKITQMYFLYENKNTQDLKEYVVNWDEEYVKSILEQLVSINNHVSSEKLPERPEEAKNKSCSFCRYCHYKLSCWKV